MPKVTQAAAVQAPAAAPMTGAAPTTIAGSSMGFAIPPGAPPPKLASAGAEFEQTGLADKFNGRCESLWYCLRKYKTGKKAESYSLFVELNIRADDPSLGTNGLVSEYFRADDLRQWVPSRTDPQWNGQQWVYTPAGSINGQPVSMDVFRALADGLSGFPSGKFKADGVTPETAVTAPDDWKGWYAVPGPDNTHDNFAKNTKWDHFKKELEKTGYRQRAPHINWADLRQLLVGVYGFWVRLPYVFGDGTQQMDQQQGQGERKPIDPLCLGQVLDLGPISGAGGPVAAGVSAMAVPAAQSLTMAPAAAAAVQYRDPASPPPAPAPVQMDMPTAPAPASVPAAQVAPMPASATPDAKALAEAITNQVLTELAQARGAAGISKADAGNAVFEKAGANGLLFLNSADWMVGDDRTFGYVPEKGLIVPLS